MVKDKLQKDTCYLESNIHIYKYRLNIIKKMEAILKFGYPLLNVGLFTSNKSLKSA